MLGVLACLRLLPFIPGCSSVPWEWFWFVPFGSCFYHVLGTSGSLLPLGLIIPHLGGKTLALPDAPHITRLSGPAGGCWPRSYSEWAVEPVALIPLGGSFPSLCWSALCCICEGLSAALWGPWSMQLSLLCPANPSCCGLPRPPAPSSRLRALPGPPWMLWPGRCLKAVSRGFAGSPCQPPSLVDHGHAWPGVQCLENHRFTNVANILASCLR